MTTDKALWQAINAYTPDVANVALPFTRRLARDMNWSLPHAEAVVTEYKKFIYLICLSGTVLTPSDAVDEAWHLHLLYTRDYWDRFCGEVLGRAIHHTPTTGGPAEDAKYREAYGRTLALYEAEFGTPPPGIWPQPSQRFASPAFVIRLPKRQAFLSLAAVGSLTLGGCVLEPTLVPGLAVLAWLCVATLAVALYLLNSSRIAERGLWQFIILAGAFSVGAGFLLGDPLAGLLGNLAGQQIEPSVAAPLAALVGYALAIPIHLAAKGEGGSGCGGSDSGCGGGCGGD